MVGFANTLALIAWMVIPAGIVYWLLIHGLLPIWRHLGPRCTWTLVLPIVMVVTATPWFLRELVLGDGPTFHPWRVAAGVVVYLANAQLWRLGRRHLDGRTMIGVPELESSEPTSPLLSDGVYAHIRHPRYVSAWLFLLALALLLGHRSLWLLFALGVVGFATVAHLEDAELGRRYGAAFADYARRVPRFLPRGLGLRAVGAGK